MYYMLKTENLKLYVVNEDMEVAEYRADIPLYEHRFSGGWTISGVAPVVPFGQVGFMRSIESILDGKDEVALVYKNGRGNHVVVDNDHGTDRIWSDRVTAVWTTEN